jgi:hypothetical protein
MCSSQNGQWAWLWTDTVYFLPKNPFYVMKLRVFTAMQDFITIVLNIGARRTFS